MVREMKTRDVNNKIVSLMKIFQAFLGDISTVIASECRADEKREQIFIPPTIMDFNLNRKLASRRMSTMPR